ncbi:MAG: hypothetical protein IT541_06070 [Hyphomicrobiales bacterium]|nr:hypothetical protein [Hyphomicrobiales bacterium]
MPSRTLRWRRNDIKKWAVRNAPPLFSPNQPSSNNVEKIQKDDDWNGYSDEPKQYSAHLLLHLSFDAAITFAAEQGSPLIQQFFHSWNTFPPNALGVEWRACSSGFPPGNRLNSLRQEMEMNSIIYLVGLVVVVLFVLSLLGLR